MNKIIKERETDKMGGDLLQGDKVRNGVSTPNEKFVDLKLAVDDTSTSGKFIQIRALLTNISLAMSVGEVMAADVQFQANGAPEAGGVVI